MCAHIWTATEAHDVSEFVGTRKTYSPTEKEKPALDYSSFMECSLRRTVVYFFYHREFVICAQRWYAHCGTLRNRPSKCSARNPVTEFPAIHHYLSAHSKQSEKAIISDKRYSASLILRYEHIIALAAYGPWHQMKKRLFVRCRHLRSPSTGTSDIIYAHSNIRPLLYAGSRGGRSYC